MLCGICAHLASTAPTYNLVKAANLDRDERGNDEENLTDMVWVVSFLLHSWLLSAARGEEPSSLLRTPITLCISVCLLDTSSWNLSYPLLYNPQTSASFIHPPNPDSSNKFSPRIIKKQTQQPWCPLSTVQPGHALCSLLRENRYEVRSDRSKAFVPWQLLILTDTFL